MSHMYGDRYDLIRDSLQLDDRNEVMEKLKNYWLLKRRSRNGVPLVTYPNSYCLKKAEESLEVETEEKVADEVDLGHDDDDDDDADDDSLSEEGSTMVISSLQSLSSLQPSFYNVNYRTLCYA